MEDWMSRNTVDDVSQAINTQVIQTTLEKSNTDLSPQALQSFMTQAPIPRAYYTMDPTWTVNTGLNQSLNWVPSATSVDPYGIIIGGGGVVNTIVIPIDGFYLFNVGWAMTGGGGGYMNVYFYDPTVGLAPQYTSWLQSPAVGTAWQGALTMLRPFRAGKRLAVNVGNVTGAFLTVNPTETNNISIAWVAPYNNYQGGQ